MIKYDEKAHIYSIDNRIIPNVTGIIERGGLSNFFNVSQEELSKKATLGKFVHLISSLYDYDADNVEIDEIALTFKTYLNGWIKFRKDLNFIPDEIETIVYSKRYNFAGRLDRVGKINKIITLVDIKTGSDIPPSTAIQTAGYMIAYNENRKVKDQIKRRIAVLIREDGTYKIKEFKDLTDKNVFLACLTINNFKKKEIQDEQNND